LVPNFNKALYESVTSALPTVPFVTVLTDMADYPPHIWIEPNQAQHLVCGTSHAAEQARAAGYADEQISLTSGMILRPAFYEQPEIDHETECLELGLDPEKPTGIVMFGGHGSTDMLRIAKALPDIQLIFLCGMNATLNKKISALKPSARHVVIGFTQKINHYMQLGDFFIGKPGPSSLSEAVHMGLPVITFGNAWTMPQERYNTNWVREQGVGLVIPSLRAIRKGVLALLENLPAYKDTVSRIENRAVFEVTDIFFLFFGVRARTLYMTVLSLYLYGGLWAYSTVFANSFAANAPVVFMNGGQTCNIEEGGGECSQNYAR
jgi:UDP-N-acetylglucosamine:LPS N-acetylglucosamine transferase